MRKEVGPLSKRTAAGSALLRYLEAVCMMLVLDHESKVSSLQCVLYFRSWIVAYSTGNYIQYLVLNHNGKDGIPCAAAG